VSNYAKGRGFEQRARSRLEQRGYFVVRSAGSKTPVDLVAIKSNERPLFVQCKGGTRSLSRAQRLAFVDFAHDLGAVPVLCERGLRFTVLGEAA
jgi:Holliday junction resolvase